MLTKLQKTAQMQSLKDSMSKAQSVMFAAYIGLSVGNITKLRRELKVGGAAMQVGKKTLMHIAAKEAGLPVIAESALPGPVACIFSFTDPLSGAQIAFKFGKEHNQVALLGGIFDGKVLSKEEAIELAKIPGRQALLGVFAGMLQSPLRSFASQCASPLTSFARALQERSKQLPPA